MTPQVHGSGHLTHGKLLIPSALQWAGGIGRLNEPTQHTTNNNQQSNDQSPTYC